MVRGHAIIRTPTKAALLTLALVFAASQPEAVRAASSVTFTVADGGNNTLDATSQYNGESPQLDFVLMMPGSYHGQTIWAISKFSLGLLPPGTTAADVIRAKLSIPDTGVVRAGQPGSIAVVLHHFATADNQKVINSDRHEHSPALTNYGIIIPAGGTGRASSVSVVDVDVTAAVKSDLQQGRALSSFRIGHDPGALAGHSAIDAYQFGSADCAADPSLHGNFCPPDGAPNIMRLTITLGPAEDCTNGIDDDGDGFVDCNDTECIGIAPCSSRLPDACFENAADYTYMWWANGLRDPSRVFNIQTSRYGLSFDYDGFELTRLGPFASYISEALALLQENTIVDTLPAASLTCAVERDGVRHVAVSAGPAPWDCRLVDSGRFFQRRWLDAINWSPSLPSVTTRLEIAAWPDRIALNLHAKPNAAASNGALEITLDLDSLFSTLVTSGNAAGLCTSQGAGFVLLASGPGAQLTVNQPATSCTVRAPFANWPAGTEKVIGLIVYPVSQDCPLVTQRAATSESSPLTVSVTGAAPVQYDSAQGWHRVSLPAGGFVWPDNDWIQGLGVTIENPSSFPRVARLNFYTDSPASVTGVSAILRDVDGYPVGIPVQLSKNWHGYSWFHGLTMLTVLPQSSISFEFTSVYAHWGGVAAASHAQLSLVGYPHGGAFGNQLWDQAAIGSWGESITFDPDLTLSRAMVDDVRPLMVWAMGSQTPTKWTWTNNVGGADFLVYHDASGQRRSPRRMRTRYRRYCPNLTEVTYAGQSDDRKIDLACTVSLYRTDDLLRGCYRLRYDVREPVSFSRLAFFQMGADNYNDHQFNLMARGNENGLIEEWSPPKGGGYSRTGIACTGLAPWFSLHDAISQDGSAYGAWANRGVIIRSWKARLGGQQAPVPYAAVIGTHNWLPSAAVELSAPPGITQLLPGDYVEVDLVQVVMPQYASDYYGPNTALKSALTTHENTWRMIHREAIGNHLEIAVTQGTLENAYPVRIRAAPDGSVEISVTGGLGYVPFSFTGLADYREYTLHRLVGDNWIPVDQSVHGRDYWQADYDAETGEWELTWTVPLDTPDDVRQTRHFRLCPVVGCPPLGACCRRQDATCTLDTAANCVAQAGTYFGDGTVCPPAPCTPHAPGDFDLDGDVDQSDFGFLQFCFTAGVPHVIQPGCGIADLNADNRIDQSDFTIFRQCFSGPGVPADVNCAD